MANDKNFKVKNGVSVGTNVVLEGTNFNTTLTKTEPTANRTITFPNATGTVVLGDGLTTYSVKASSTTGGANLDLDAAGANTNTDSVKFAGAGISVVTQTDASTITITSTEADTLATVTGRGATTSTALSITNATQASSTSTGSLVLSGGLGIAKNLYVGENMVITGNLTVQGTQTTISTSTLTVSDKTIELGVITTPTDVTADGGGIELKGATDKTILWDNTNDNWTSSENWNLATGKSFKIDNTVVLTSTQVLGKGFTDAAGEIVTTDATQTLTNKTLSGGAASNLTGLSMDSGVAISLFSNDATLAGNSSAAVPTEAAVKGYVDGALTTYSVKASSTTGGANLDLDAAGANTGTDSVKFAGAGSVSIAQTDANTITVTGATPGNGGLTLQVGGTAAATNNTVTVSTGTGFTANASSASTYELRIGPALTAFASQMTGAGTGFLRKNGADTFSLDTSSYLTSYTETDTLSSVTGRGATTSTAVTFSGGMTLTTGSSPLTLSATSTNRITTGNENLLELSTRTSASSSGGITIKTGNAANGSFNSGDLIIQTGDGGFNSGDITIRGGVSGGAGLTYGGDINIRGGLASSGSAGVGGSVYIDGGYPSTSSNTVGNVHVGTNYTELSAGTQSVYIGHSASRNYIRGITEYTSSTEVLNTKTSATGTVVHNLTEGNTWYHSSISANFTANFTNVPTTNNRTIVCTLVLVQGATPYIPTAVQIDGVAQTINWTGQSGTPSGDANDTNIATFILIRQGSSWSVLGSVVNNPAASTLQAVTTSGASTSNAVSITNATASTTTSNGALIVTGGIGAGGNISALTVNGLYLSGLYGSNYNVAIGEASMRDGTVNVSNVAIGVGSMQTTNNIAQSVAIGGFALPIASGEKNIAIGFGAGSDLSNGSNNVIIGGASGSNITGTSNNVIIADGAGNIILSANGSTQTVTIPGSLSVTGLTTLQETTEVLNTKTTATGTVVHDFLTGAIWVHSSISANFTANFTNVPTTDNRTINVVLVLIQGATARIPNAVQIAGSGQTILWQGGTAPTGNANKRDIVSFTLLRTGSAWTVLGSLSTYG
jgi:hypothetical protein